MKIPALITQNVDTSARPQDDLFRHANGTWLDTAQIPDDKPATGAFTDLYDESQRRVKSIIEELAAGSPAAGSDAQRIADLYASFMDEEAIEARGAEPLAEPLRRVDSCTSSEEFMALCGWLAHRGYGTLIHVGPESDPAEPKTVVAYIEQGGIGLPDEAYYRDDDKAEIRAQYVRHIERMFTLAGLDNPAAQAATVMELETKIASCHWDLVRCRDLEQMFNPMSLQQLDADTPALHWPEFMAQAGLQPEQLERLINAQPSYFTGVAALVSSEPVEAWRSWARWRVISRLAMFLSSDFVNERFHFTGTVLSGTPTLRARWKRGVALVESVLGEAVGKLYVERHFPPQAKERMDELVANIVEAYRRSITELDWMTDVTKEQALDKLAKFRPKIGFPSKWRDYSALEIKPGDLIGNLERATKFDTDYYLAKIGKQRDVEEWLMTPQTVNAYYHPFYNEIVFPAAILQPPFFNVDADDAVNYGAIGAVIGHEIGHGFDDQGSTCDGDGVLRNWWTDADREAFSARTKALIGQYDALRPEQAPDLHVNGALTIGENIGDLGGLSIALLAWEISCNGNEPAPIDGLTGLQRVFLGWASVWRQVMRPEAVRQRVATDPHSPNEFRCNQVVRNIPQFYAAFGVQPGDKLWLDEGQRVKIW